MRKVFLLMFAMCLICSSANALFEATGVTRDDKAKPVYQYERVNAGDTFLSTASSVDLANDASQTLLLTVSTTNTFIVPKVSSDGGGTTYFYEGPTVSTIGTNSAPVQLNRPLSVSNTTSITSSYGATCSAYGTLLDTAVVDDGEVELERTLMLAGTQYLIRHENESGAVAQVVIKAKMDEY